MMITVKLFAIIRDKVGSDSVKIELPECASVAVLLETLILTYPQLTDWKEVVRIAVNREYVDKNHIMKPGDEVAVIPPVSGG